MSLTKAQHRTYMIYGFIGTPELTLWCRRLSSRSGQNRLTPTSMFKLWIMIIWCSYLPYFLMVVWRVYTLPYHSTQSSDRPTAPNKFKIPLVNRDSQSMDDNLQWLVMLESSPMKINSHCSDRFNPMNSHETAIFALGSIHEFPWFLEISHGNHPWKSWWSSQFPVKFPFHPSKCPMEITHSFGDPRPSSAAMNPRALQRIFAPARRQAQDP